MATRRQPPGRAAGDDPPVAAGRDDSTEQALARSRAIRKQGDRQMQASREYLAATRRSGPGAGPRSSAQDPAARLIDAGEQIERSRQARANLAALAAKLVQTEEAAARLHDKIADRDPPHAAEYRRAAEDARQAADRAREIQRDADPG
jgi:hypothetical protein